MAIQKFLMHKNGRVFVYDEVLHKMNDEVRVCYGEMRDGSFVESGGGDEGPTLHLNRQNLMIFTKQQLIALFGDLFASADIPKDEMIDLIIGAKPENGNGADRSQHDQYGGVGLERQPVRPMQPGEVR